MSLYLQIYWFCLVVLCASVFGTPYPQEPIGSEDETPDDNLEDMKQEVARINDELQETIEKYNTLRASCEEPINEYLFEVVDDDTKYVLSEYFNKSSKRKSLVQEITVLKVKQEIVELEIIIHKHEISYVKAIWNHLVDHLENFMLPFDHQRDIWPNLSEVLQRLLKDKEGMAKWMEDAILVRVPINEDEVELDVETENLNDWNVDRKTFYERRIQFLRPEADRWQRKLMTLKEECDNIVKPEVQELNSILEEGNQDNSKIQDFLSKRIDELDIEIQGLTTTLENAQIVLEEAYDKMGKLPILQNYTTYLKLISDLKHINFKSPSFSGS